ncbi:MAG: hypothetical protein FJY46_09960 [Betaproteobacteria bacterium]|jgi:lipoprotein NlpD|nr:hypothetical protein [Betaproteobacteria bacterium]
MTYSVCKLDSVHVSGQREATIMRSRWTVIVVIVMSGWLASCSTPRAPAPIVDRSSKVPPVVIISSVGQGKPNAGNSATQSSETKGKSTAPSTVMRPSEPGPAASRQETSSDPQAAPAASAKPIRNPQIVSSTRSDISSRADVPNRNERSPISDTPAKGSSQPSEPIPQASSTAKPPDVGRDTPRPNESKPAMASSEDKDADRGAVTTKPAEVDIEWIWPAEGKAFSTFNGGKGGIRIEGQSGDPILAIGDGKVIFAGQGPKGYGNLLIVRHEGELLSVYAHNRALLVQEGSQVKKGQKIAEMGDSGADRIQLGFELRRHGRPIDPRTALPQR